jgi:hypothetical protein
MRNNIYISKIGLDGLKTTIDELKRLLGKIKFESCYLSQRAEIWQKTNE